MTTERKLSVINIQYCLKNVLSVASRALCNLDPNCFHNLMNDCSLITFCSYHSSHQGLPKFKENWHILKNMLWNREIGLSTMPQKPNEILPQTIICYPRICSQPFSLDQFPSPSGHCLCTQLTSVSAISHLHSICSVTITWCIVTNRYLLTIFWS
jgi:hypothetical protein